MPEIMKRRDAIHLGLRTYFTGKPCKHGHIANRVVPYGTCVECNRMRARLNHLKDPEYKRAWQRANPEKMKEYVRRYNAKKAAKYDAWCLRHRHVRVHPDFLS